MNVLFRGQIPLSMQGRVYSTRNTQQFFTISIGYLAGGILVDYVFELFEITVARQRLTGIRAAQVFGKLLFLPYQSRRNL